MKRDVPYIPRFYIDETQYATAINRVAFDNVEIDSDNLTYTWRGGDQQFICDMNPARFLEFPASTNHEIFIPTGHANRHELETTKKYIAILGHNLLASGSDVELTFGDNSVDDGFSFANTSDVSINEIINWKGASMTQTSGTFSYNGFSICEIIANLDYNDSEAGIEVNNYKDLRIKLENTNANRSAGIGAVSYGSVYDMPLPADLQMTIAYEFGNDKIDTLSGKTFINRNWFQKPKWVNYQAPWGLDTLEESGLTSNFNPMPESDLRKAGRRIYDLSFSFLSDDDVFATNPNVTTAGMQDNLFAGDTISYTPEDSNNTNLQLVGSSSITGTDDILTLYNDNSIFSQLVQKTAGFSIPFIFQPNKNYARPDGFMYAVIDQNSIEIEQIGVNLFRTSLRIKEVW